MAGVGAFAVRRLEKVVAAGRQLGDDGPHEPPGLLRFRDPLRACLAMSCCPCMDKLPSQLHAWGIVLPAALGAGLGLAAYIPDMLEESAAPYATPFFSSGFAWGFIALLAGYMTRRQKISITVGGATLAIAVITYYCLILFVSQRWYINPSDTEDGLASSAGLLSVGRSIGFWVVGAIIGGGIMGWLGCATRHAPAWQGSVLLGVTLGLLTGEGVFTLIYVRSIWLGPLDAFDLSKLVPSLAQIVFGLGAVAFMASLRKQPIARLAVSAAGTASVVANVLLWYAVLSIRINL